MKTLRQQTRFSPPTAQFRRIVAITLFFWLLVWSVRATVPWPGDPPPWLDTWTFNNTNTWVTSKGYAALSFTNLSTSELGDYLAVILDDTNAPAWLNYNITETDGTNHFRVGGPGSVMFWFAPNWCGTNQGGTGPGEWSRLLEVGAYTTNASYGWWSLYTDPAGVNLYFSAQTNNGYGATYLTAPIHWDITNRWHLLALTYSGTNSALWVDAVLLTNGLPVTYWPGPDVLADGFFIGSDSSGLSQAHGMFDDMVTYAYQIDGATISNVFGYQSLWYYLNPMNAANLVASAPSSPTLTPSFNAVTGQGYLIPVTNAFNNCLTNSQVWLTNVVASMTSNLTMDVTFTIAGGSNAVSYDVFANSMLDFSTNRERAWAWMGQGSHCMTYLLTNLPYSGTFIILGTPLDSDGDGLTDAYEHLVSKTNPQIPDTDGDGKPDGWEKLLETDPLTYDFPSSLALPAADSCYLRILAPDLLEMVRISTDTNTWNFVSNGVAVPPATNQFQVKSGGSSVAVTQVGFKRRPLYAPIGQYDLRIENTLYLRLASTNWATSNATVEVTTTNTGLWPASMRFVSVNSPLRYSPAIHVNQAGYSPTSQKKAMLGYYLGSLGEMQISTNPGFSIVDALTGAQVASGSLSARADEPTTWATGQAQYQNVLEADFTGLTTAGQYKLLVPGLGASYPFWIHDGAPMALARTYALGLYHQRCGAGPAPLQVNDQQFTRFSHQNCHTNNAPVPLPTASYLSAWNILAEYGNDTYIKAQSDNPPQVAPPITNYSAMLFGYSNQPPQGIDVSGGHHDAGDYSKYTINSALLIHTLIFAADNLGLTNFDNLGLPESGNSTPDILEEAKWEADFLAKMQDADGGFYFLVYPKNREYDGDGNVLPQYGDPQIVWPKQTAVTAAAVGALAEIGSSPSFKAVSANYRLAATNYLRAATNGWKFLTNAIARYGKGNCYQRFTHYGDDFTHDDELAWAAAALYAATGSTVYSNKLWQWYPNPTDGHNGYNFKRYNSTNNFPASTNLFVAIAYVPKTNDVLNTTNHMWFTIWDSTGQRVVTNKIDTAIPHIADIIDFTNRLYQLKTNLNTYPDALDRNYALDAISSLVGECHKTWRFGWQQCFAGYGCAVRDYAFAARSGRLGAGLLNTAYLRQCEAEITNRAADVRIWSTNNAYRTSLDPYAKSAYAPEFYFAGERTFDLAAADRIRADAGNTNAVIENLNYEAGRNPLNVSRITGLGSYRQREIVDQFSQNNPQAVLPKSGVPLGNMSDTLDHTDLYGSLDDLCFPAFSLRGSNGFALYDRWTEAHNVTTEFVHLHTARALVSALYLVTSPTLKTQAWQRANASIVFTNGLPSLNGFRAAQLSTTQDLTGAQIVWDPGRGPWNFFGQQPAFGSNFVFAVTNGVGDPPLQAEVVFPDGRRLFAVTNLQIWTTNGGKAFTNDGNTIALYQFDSVDPIHLGDDSSGHSFNLMPHGWAHAFPNATWMASPTGGVASFGGISDYLEFTGIPYTNILASTTSTVVIEARIFPRHYINDGNLSQEILALFQNYYSSTQAAQWVVSYEPPKAPDAPQIYANPKVVLDNSAWNQAMTLNTWHSLKITFQPSGVTTACLDGTVVCRSTNSPPYYGWNNDWRLTLGHFDGDIDEVRISNTLRP